MRFRILALQVSAAPGFVGEVMDSSRADRGGRRGGNVSRQGDRGSRGVGGDA